MTAAADGSILLVAAGTAAALEKGHSRVRHFAGVVASPQRLVLHGFAHS